MPEVVRAHCVAVSGVARFFLLVHAQTVVKVLHLSHENSRCV